MNGRGPRWLWLEQVDVEVRNRTIGARTGHLAYVLAVRYANGKAEAWPSQTELAAATGLSKRTVWQALKDLERQGLLEIRYGHPAPTDGCVYQLRKPA